EGIVSDAATLVANGSGDGLGDAEEVEGVTDEVRGDVEKNSGAGTFLLAPGVGLEIRSEAIVVRLESNDAAERASGSELQDALIVAVVAPALIDGDKAATLLGELNQVERFGHCRRERLVDEDIASGSKTVVGEGIMRVVGRRDHDETDFRNGEKFIEAASNARVWIGLRGFGAGALKDCGETEPGNSTDHRRVESAPGEAETNQADVDGVARGLRGVCRVCGCGQVSGPDKA